MRNDRRIALTGLLLLLIGCPSEPPVDACPAGEIEDTSVEPAVCVPSDCGVGPWGPRIPEVQTLFVAPWGSDEARGSQDAPLVSLVEAVRRARELRADTDEPLGIIAASREGAEPAEYIGSLNIESLPDLELAGRCRELVTVVASDPTEEVPYPSPVRLLEGSSGALVRDLSATGTRLGIVVGTDVRVRRVEVFGPVHQGLWVTASGDLDARGLRLIDIEPNGVLSPNETWALTVHNASSATSRQPRVTVEDLLVVGAGAVAVAALFGDVEIVGATFDGRGGSSERSTGAFAVKGRADVVVRDFELRDVGGFAASAEAGGRLTLENGTIDGVDGPIDPTGAIVFEEGEITLRAVEMRRVRRIAVNAQGKQGKEAIITLDDVTIDEMLGTPGDEGWDFGYPVVATAGGRIEAVDLSIVDGLGSGVVAYDAGTVVTLRGGSTIRGVRPYDSQSTDVISAAAVVVSDGAHFSAEPGVTLGPNSGFALQIESGGTADVVEGVLEGNEVAGVFCDRCGSISLTDTWIRGTGTSLGVAAAEEIGAGISIDCGGATTPCGPVTVTRGGLQGNLTSGIFARGSAVLQLTDTSVLATLPRGDGQFGRGIEIQDGVELLATNVVIADNADIGLYAAGEGTRLDLTSVEVRDTRPRSDGGGGRGFNLQDGAVMEATDLLVSANAEVGLFLADADATVSDSVISDTLSVSDGRFGRGVVVAEGALLSLTRVAVLDNLEMGVHVLGSGTSVTLDDCTVEGTRQGSTPGGGRAITTTSGAYANLIGGSYGDGPGPALMASSGGLIEATGVRLHASGFAGIVVLDDAEVEFVGGVIEDVASSPDFGGGVGAFADSTEFSGALRVSDVSVSGVAQAGAYLLGPGSFELARVEFTGESGTGPGLAGIFAADGVGPWSAASSSGLHVSGCSFAALPSHGILFDAAGGTLDSDDTSGPNTFADLGGDPIYAQNCGPLIEVFDGSVAAPVCGVALPLGPRLDFGVVIDEVGPID